MKNTIKDIVSMIVYLAGVLVAVWLIITFLGQRTVVDGTSMMPTLRHGDNLICDKITYRFRDPERFDIVVFPYKYKPNVHYIKRIIGMPGETVQIDPMGNIYINGTILKESYGMEVIARDKVGRAAQAITLGEDEYFLMGDNRNNSMDSRTDQVGNVKRSEIIGRAWLRIWPLNSFGILKHQ